MTPNVQGSDEIVVNAPPEAIWHILTDTTRLPEWAPMVKQTNGTAESLGAVRQCEVEFDRRPGKVTERCSKFRPHERIAWVMEQDSFGFGRMFAAFGFEFTLVRQPDGSTRLINDSFWQPKHLLASVMSRFMMRPKSRRIRQQVLRNLKELAEQDTAVTAASHKQQTPKRRTKPMGAPVMHFEIVGKDAKKLQDFYASLFDWKIDANNPMNYGMVDNAGQGINGGVGPSQSGQPWVGFYVAVENLQAALDKAGSMGGTTIMPPTQIPDGPSIAVFSDPEGNQIGLLSGM